MWIRIETGILACNNYISFYILPYYETIKGYKFLQSEGLLLYADLPRFIWKVKVKVKINICVCLCKHRAVGDSS
jgi:hypothetical protein